MHICSLPFPEVKEEAATNEDELSEWLHSKVDPFARADKPPKYHPNIYFQEFYYEFDKGKDTSVSTVVEERLQRQGMDMQSSTSMMSLENEMKDKKGDPQVKFNAMISKIMGMVKKLQTTINNTESALPGLKRTIPTLSFKQIRDGLSQSRDYKEDCLYRVEDWKAEGWQPQQGDETMDAMTQMHKNLMEHSQALVEALKTHQQPVIKEAPSEDGDVDSGARLFMKTMNAKQKMLPLSLQLSLAF